MDSDVDLDLLHALPFSGGLPVNPAAAMSIVEGCGHDLSTIEGGQLPGGPVHAAGGGVAKKSGCLGNGEG